MTDEPFFVKLENRGLIRVSGPDRHKFLQNLISNNIETLKTKPSLYACLLTAQGKFLHDFIITENNNEFWMDCEGHERTKDLTKRLVAYKLRSDVEISFEEQKDVFAIFGKAEGIPDPRHKDMGYRSFEKPNLPEKPFEEWDRQRITLAIPDGSRDMVPENSTLLECNIDKLNGIDFDKGCYVGQEITARMHYRGLAKKHLYAVKGDTFNIPASIGEMRSSCGDIGLALLKDSELKKLDQIALRLLAP